MVLFRCLTSLSMRRELGRVQAELTRVSKQLDDLRSRATESFCAQIRSFLSAITPCGEQRGLKNRFTELCQTKEWLKGALQTQYQANKKRMMFAALGVATLGLGYLVFSKMGVSAGSLNEEAKRDLERYRPKNWKGDHSICLLQGEPGPCNSWSKSPYAGGSSPITNPEEMRVGDYACALNSRRLHEERVGNLKNAVDLYKEDLIKNPEDPEKRLGALKSALALTQVMRPPAKETLETACEAFRRVFACYLLGHTSFYSDAQTANTWNQVLCICPPPGKFSNETCQTL